jgi:hypothetical protein
VRLLNVLQQRAPRRLHLRWAARALFVWLYRHCPRILDAATIVSPETVVRWHRMGLAAYRRWKSRPRGGRPRIGKEVRDLIRRMFPSAPTKSATSCNFQLVQAQTDGYCDHRRKCSHCGSRRAIKDWRTRQLTTLFGVVQVEAPRFNACRCGVTSRRIVSPLAEIMPDRYTPEYERILAKMGSLAAYGRAVALMAEFLPLGHTHAIETARRRTLQVGAKLERQILTAKPLVAPP